MGFYDSVKDDVRDEHAPEQESVEPGENEEDKGGNMAFDQLKQNASQQEDAEDAEEEDNTSTTQIEVLTEDGLQPEDSTEKPSSVSEQETQNQRGQQAESAPEPTETAQDAGEQAPKRTKDIFSDGQQASETLERIADAMETVQEQNAEIIRLLEEASQ